MQPSSSIDRASAFLFRQSLSPISLPKLYNSAGSRDNQILPGQRCCISAVAHSTFSLSDGNFYLEDLCRSKSTLGYFDQLASHGSLAYPLLNPLANEPESKHD